VIITEDMLTLFRACEDAKQEFARRFPDGLDIGGLWLDRDARARTWRRILDDEFLRRYMGWAIGKGLLPARIIGNFSGADLSRAVLSGADLSRAVLSGAVLSGAFLNGVDLSDAVLSDADLRGAVLSRADLRRADLSGAVLSGADLSRADLRRADLSGADLSGAIVCNHTTGIDFEIAGLVKIGD